MLDALFSNLPVLQKSLHGLTARQRAIGENVANADTPNFKRLEVAFEQELRKTVEGQAGESAELPLRTASARHFSLGPGGDGEVSIQRIDDEVYRNDGNNVDAELEMAKLAETSVRYSTVAKLARDKFEGLKSLLREVR